MNTETVAALEVANKATDLVERYGNAIIQISEALAKNATGGGVFKARVIIAGLEMDPPLHA